MGGIGFIGAGVILRDDRAQTVENLTTAATVWLTAGLGIACGLAAWNVIAIVTLIGISWLEATYLQRHAGNKPRARSAKRSFIEHEEESNLLPARGVHQGLGHCCQHLIS